MEGALPRSAPSPQELADLAITLAAQAGEEMQRRRSAGLRVSSKSSSTDLVTDADRAVERLLVQELARLRPDDLVLGEEGAWTSGADSPQNSHGTDAPAESGQVCWVIDPIDGTVNFTLGQPYYAVSIAARIGATVVAGAVLNPVSGELFHACLGQGAFLRQGAALRPGAFLRQGASPRPPAASASPAASEPGADVRLAGPRAVRLEETVVATGFSYDRAWRAHQGRVVAQLLPRVGNLRRSGSAALDLCALAAGRVDLYYECPLHEWDYAAGLLIAHEAGVQTSGLRGRQAGDWLVAGGHETNAAPFFQLLTELSADRPLVSEDSGLA